MRQLVRPFLVLLVLFGAVGFLITACSSQGPRVENQSQVDARRTMPGPSTAGTARGKNLDVGLGPPAPMPTTLRRRILRSIPDIRGLDLRFRRAHSIETTAGVELWLISGRGTACLVDAGTGALSCDAIASVNRRGIYLATYWLSDLQRAHRTNFRVVGIATQSQTSIPAIVGARRVSIPVEHRTFEHHADAPIRLQLGL